MRKNNLILIFLFIIPYLLIFRSFFQNGHLVWGDAPFFYLENLCELFNWPLLWDFRNDNLGAPQSTVTWLYLPTYLYGLLHHFLKWDNDLLIRLIFYFPATILAFLGSSIFLRKFTKNIYANFLGAFLYTFNTYFLTLVDGGVVGLSLGYGIFPLVIYSVLDFLEKGTLFKYSTALFFSLLITNTDLRLALLAFILIILLIIIQINKYFKLQDRWYYLVILLLPLLLINSFWLIPLFLNTTDIYLSTNNNGTLVDLLHALTLYSPHFPDNNFGKTMPVPFYFSFILVLLLGLNIAIKTINKQKEIFLIILLYLLFVFLTKGTADPFGEIYIWLVNLPWGIAFRDSTKFFCPLLLISSILLASTIENLFINLNRKIFLGIFLAIYTYLLLLIYPAFFHQMSGVLGKPIKDFNLEEIARIISNDNQFFRTLWMIEKPPLGYADWQHPSLSANKLYKERPFASMNNGKFDLDNFIYDINFAKWAELLGIKYIFLTGNQRNKNPKEQNLIREDLIIRWLEKNPYLEKLNWFSDLPVFKTQLQMPILFTQNKVFLVIGGEDIYQKLFKLSTFVLANQGFLFLEDGKIKPETLLNLADKSLVILFNKKNDQDIIMFFLQNKMIPMNSSDNNQWAYRDSQEYLSWKYDLSLNGIDNREFDYQKGMSFSTIAGEKIEFNLKIPNSGKYYLAIRYINKIGDQGIKIIFNNQEKLLVNGSTQYFKWNILGPYDLSNNIYQLQIINLSSFAMVNTIALVSEEEYKKAQQETIQLLNKFQIYFINNDNDLLKTFNSTKLFSKISYQQINPTEYKISLPDDANWLIFTEHYNQDWKIANNQNIYSLPLYSMINGFYVKSLTGKEIILIYKPQLLMKKWIIISSFSLIMTVGGILSFYWYYRNK